ncbi:Hypothetical predicted protein [Mytilus galloprovincialis]|uniref:Uncharacterized protein n=1 Tax=Mytilus galloprovincialis TaxID=29158 RepID=A0A8B6ELH8_MYTGA|nr:Hypothetical predicted protein [Mytilus galloprovincialis]VDI49969.1 Hypothetical predicted protein [Mytilus galloprovincialis]
MELNNSQYVLDPRTWIMYYENLANDKHHNSYLNNSYRRTIQSGGSLTNSAASFMEPITLPQSKPHAQSPIKLVTHAQQQVENAKSEISRAVKKIKRKRGKLQNSNRKSHRGEQKKTKKTKKGGRKNKTNSKKGSVQSVKKRLKNQLIEKDIFQ